MALDLRQNYALNGKTESTLFFQNKLEANTKELKKTTQDYHETKNFETWRGFLAEIFRELSRIYKAASSNQKESRYKGIICNHALRAVLRENENANWGSLQDSPEKTYPWNKDTIFNSELEKDTVNYTRLKKFRLFDQEVFKKYQKELEQHPFSEDNFQYLIDYAADELANDFLYIINYKSNLEKEKEQNDYEKWVDSGLTSDSLLRKKNTCLIEQSLEAINEKIKTLKFQLQKTGLEFTAIPSMIDNADKYTISEVSELSLLTDELEFYNSVKEARKLFNKNKEINTQRAFNRKQSLLTDSGKNEVDWEFLASKTKEVVLQCFQIQKNICEPSLFEQVVIDYKNLKLDLLGNFTPSKNCVDNLAPYCKQYEKHSLLAQRYIEDEELNTKVARKNTNNTLKLKNDYFSANLFWSAIENKNKEELEKQLQKKPSMEVCKVKGYSPAHLAIFCDFKEGLELMPEANYLAPTNKNVMHIPVKEGVNCIQLAGALSNVEIIDLLLSKLDTSYATEALNYTIDPSKALTKPQESWKTIAFGSVINLMANHKPDWKIAHKTNLELMKSSEDPEVKEVRQKIHRYLETFKEIIPKTNSSPSIISSKFFQALTPNSSPPTSRNSTPLRRSKTDSIKEKQ